MKALSIDFSVEWLRSQVVLDETTGRLKWLCHRYPSWVGAIAGQLGKDGYRRINLNGRRYAEHRIVWFYVTGNDPGEIVDHRDLDKSNSQFSNFRLASPDNSNANRGRPRNNTSGFKGVTYLRKQSKYQAQIGHAGKNIYLGVFGTADEAHAAYSKAALELHGEFARLS